MNNIVENFRQKRADIITKKEQLKDELVEPSPFPQIGDIFIHSKSMELQWMVVENSQDLLIIPADNNPLVGSNDVKVADRALSAPLTLRCGYQLSIAQTQFQKHSLRVGILENWYLQRALDKIRQIETGKLRSSVLQQETDSDPDYKEWMEQVVNPGLEAIKTAKPRIGIRTIYNKLKNAVSNLFSAKIPPLSWAVAAILVLTVSLTFVCWMVCRIPVYELSYYFGN